MIPLIRADLRRLFTVRSTYLIFAGLLVLEVVFAGIIDGYNAAAAALHSSGTLANEVTQAIAATAGLAAIVGLLLLAHEYRYNTIMYTLTASRSRARVLWAKIIAVTIFTLPLIFVIGTLSPLLALLGMHVHHLHLVHQTLDIPNLIWRGLFFGWAYAMIALVFVAIIRSQVGAVVVYFIAPGTVESLLGILLKDNVKYLPFASLTNIINQMPQASAGSIRQSVITVCCYLVVAWIAAFILFLRRDAN